MARISFRQRRRSVSPCWRNRPRYTLFLAVVRYECGGQRQKRTNLGGLALPDLPAGRRPAAHRAPLPESKFHVVALAAMRPVQPHENQSGRIAPFFLTVSDPPTGFRQFFLFLLT